MTRTLLLLATLAGAQAPRDSLPLGTGKTSVVSDADTAALTVHGTTIVVFRGRLGAASPGERAEAAARRIDEAIAASSVDSLRVVPTTEGVLVQSGSRALFLITRGDAEGAQGQTPAHMATRAVVTLRRAMELESRERSVGYLLRAAGAALAATVLFGLAIFVLRRVAARGYVPAAEPTRRLAAFRVGGFTLFSARQVGLLAGRAVVVGAWVAGAVLAYLWLTFVLTRFPISRPWGEALGGLLLGTANELVLDGLSAVPGIITVILIFVVARWLAKLLSGFFTAVERGWVHSSWVHQDTAQPTRRIALAMLWIFALVVAYPYIPGSGSDAFKGLSVFVGVVISLGSTGLVNQAMSGLVVMYTRSFRPGDYVRIGEVEGEVTALALLSTKIRTPKNEEVTIPNAAIVTGGIKNFSRLAAESGVIVHTSVTIGYDTPWRQVHGLLTLAASKTPGLRKEPAPFVLQTALSDFYVQYQLNAWLEQPGERIPVLSALHANILDAFNQYGVQIMSPHFERQPKEPVLVPPDRWQAPPTVQHDGASAGDGVPAPGAQPGS